MYLEELIIKNNLSFEEITKELKELRYQKILLETKIKNISFITSPKFNERVAGGLKKDIEDTYCKYTELINELREVEKRFNFLEEELSAICEIFKKIEDKTIIKLYYIEGLSLTSIASNLHFSYGYVRVRKTRAVKFASNFVKILLKKSKTDNKK